MSLGQATPAGQLSEAQVDAAERLYEQGWSLRAVGRHLDVADKTIRRTLLSRDVVVRSRGRIAARAMAS
jgi:hypothetical protein